MSDRPLILYIPGMLPKPRPEVHKAQLARCLLAGIRRTDPETADALADDRNAFDIVSWTYDFYGEHRDESIDLPDIVSALAKGKPDVEDIAEAVNWRRRVTHALYNVADRFPFLISRLANEAVEVHIRDLRRYVTNDNDIAGHVRRLLKIPLESAAAAGRPVLLLAHSMGSVIAWDTLWELSRRDEKRVPVDHWVTLGSPLGGHYLQRRLLGLGEEGERRFPDNIRTWTNIAAVGEMTALDRTLADDFAAMIDFRLVEDIVDIEIFNFYRIGGALNVHNEYGYLMHETTGETIARWWREAAPVV